MDDPVKSAIEWIRRAQERLTHMTPCLASSDARRFLNEARVLLGDQTELAKE